LAFDAHNLKHHSVHDGNNKRAYSIFRPLCVLCEENAAEATAMICAAYGENAVSHTTCKKCYKKFRQEDFS